MRLQILKGKSVGILKNNLGSGWTAYSDLATPLIDPVDLLDSKIETDAPPDLEPTPGADAENSEKIFQWIRMLTPVEAADERLWCALTHSLYRDYTVRRWAPTSANQVKTRFFYSGTGLETAVRNSLSRLWWFGYLTCRPESTDPFELTRVLLSNQDIQQAFTERSIGRCRVLLHCVLRYFKENAEQINSVGISEFAKELAKNLRIQSGVVLMDALPEMEMQALVNRAGVASRIRLSGSGG